MIDPALKSGDIEELQGMVRPQQEGEAWASFKTFAPKQVSPVDEGYPSEEQKGDDRFLPKVPPDNRKALSDKGEDDDQFLTQKI